MKQSTIERLWLAGVDTEMAATISGIRKSLGMPNVTEVPDIVATKPAEDAGFTSRETTKQSGAGNSIEKDIHEFFGAKPE